VNTGFEMPKGFECRSRRDGGYASPGLSDDEANLNGLVLLRSFDGVPAPVIRQVLQRALFWLDAVTVLECGESSEFARALEGLKRAAGQSL
jgi:hypothetical protein